MDKTDPKISDSDEGRSPSDNEKLAEREMLADVVNIPDPDVGLSEKERKAIVRDVNWYATPSYVTNTSQDRRLLWKLDFQLIPWLCLLYLISFLDRTNIGNAKIDGLQEDLHLMNNQYNDSLTIFFLSYSLFEPATQIMLKRFRPSIFLPTIMVLWGE